EGGNLFDYITTGECNSPNDGFHALMKVNFDSYFNAGYQAMYPINWLNDYTQNISDCKMDLFSVLLHEVGHMLGFVSLANNNGQLEPFSLFGNNNFSRLDFLMYRSNDMTATSLQKFILGTPNNCFINPIFSNISLNDKKFWSGSNDAPNNHPILSGSHYYTEESSLLNSMLSHLDEQALSYTLRSRNAPGYSENYAMGPFISNGENTRSYSDAEVVIFLNMGYNLNPLFNNSNLNNLPPYSLKIGNDPNYPKPYNDSLIQSFYQDIVNPDTVIINNVGTSVTFNLWQDTGIMDHEGQVVTVADSSLTNIRGCGNGGNNHNQLSLSADKKSITFIPRANFVGRAQFAFKLFDGVKVGSWHLYTIDVLTGNNVNYPFGSNLLINGDLEEGTEVRRSGIEQSKPNTTQEFYKEGFIRGTHFSDANPFNEYANLWGPFGAGDMIRNSWGWDYCTYGSSTNSFPTSYFPLPKSDYGDRYRSLRENYNYFGLGDSLRQFHKYVLKFDYAHKQGVFNVNQTSFPIIVGFTNNPICNDLPILENKINEHIIHAPLNTWEQKEIFFYYCSSIPTTFLNIQIGLSDVLIDNIEIREVTEIPDLEVSISGDSTICKGSSTVLSANVSNSFCNPSYLWSNGATTSSILVIPTTTQNYTVTVNDGNQSASALKNVSVLSTVATIPTFTQSNPICHGVPVYPLSTTSSNLISGVWYPELNDTISTTYTFIPNSGQCASVTTMDIVVIEPISPISITDTIFCYGSNMNDLAAIPTNGITGTWSPIFFYLGIGTKNFTFTPNYGQCATTATLTVTVIPLPTNSITTQDSTIICQGDSVVLYTNVGADITYQWKMNGEFLEGEAGASYTATESGSYTSVLTNNSNCTSTSLPIVITVNPISTPTFNQIAPIISGTVLNELPTSSTNGIIGTWSPALNNTATTTYTFTPNEGQCAPLTTMTVIVNPDSTTFSWLVYPTPTNGSLTLQFSGLNADAQLLIVDSRGRLVRKISISKNIESYSLDISALAAGEYFLNLENQNIKEKKKITKF
ncbi:MAG: T9SS C-terminal target domain-containing protein, partial [Flavobacteriales bacterium]|nr:T9SS C-terminal target domain-containing protein [Flavobacteriales bacterium]